MSNRKNNFSSVKGTVLNPQINVIADAHRENEFILPNTQTFSLDMIKTRLNNNVAIFGSSGSGKTRCIITPNLLAAVGSYIVSDPKGALYRKWGDHFRNIGYNVMRLNFINPKESAKFNPLSFIRNTDDIKKLAHQFVEADNSQLKNTDPFWNNSAEMLISGIIGLVCEKYENPADRDFSYVFEYLAKISPSEIEGGSGRFYRELNDHELKYYNSHKRKSWAAEQIRKFDKLGSKTMACVMVTIQSILAKISSKEVLSMLSTNEIDITSIAKKESIVFVEISDTDRSKDFLANLFYSHTLNTLCTYADTQCEDGRLPIMVRYFLDDFATNCKIEDFDNMISNIRARNISAVIVLQSLGQLKDSYDVGANTIVDNCDTVIYMGGNDSMTAQFVSQKVNKPVSKVLQLELSKAWIVRRGCKPICDGTVDISEYNLDNLPDLTQKAEENEVLL